MINWNAVPETTLLDISRKRNLLIESWYEASDKAITDHSQKIADEIEFYESERDRLNEKYLEVLGENGII